jgi:putative (di)nucleoside polyphosphate hydrolase
MRGGAPGADGYRSNVGIVLFNAAGLVLLAKRTGGAEPHCWQFPQGGIDSGEEPVDAAARELEEETGIPPALTIFLGASEGWLVYDFPPDVRASQKNPDWKGQRQKWFAYRFLGRDADIDLVRCVSDEFEAWRWARLEEAPALVIPWKRDVYEQVVREFARFAAPASLPAG